MPYLAGVVMAALLALVPKIIMWLLGLIGRELVAMLRDLIVLRREQNVSERV